MRRSPESVRRRRAVAISLLAGIALAAAAAGALSGSSGRHDDGGASPAHPSAGSHPSRAIARLSLERRLGQLMVMSFDGVAAPEYILRRLRDGQGTGVILFGKNAPDAASARSLTSSLQRAAAGSALVATDQEGGSIRSLPFAPPELSQARIASPPAAAAAARDAARGLRAAGVNVNLAPVADVAAGPGSVLSSRAFAGNPRLVAELTAATVRAYGRSRMGATVKHFPGLGRATANTDDASVTIPASRAELERADLAPFREAVRAGVPLVMASHALYPALDSRRIASQSQAAIGGLLRRRLGYRGAVVTDSIEAQAVLARTGVATAAERSIEAGCDLILMTGSGSFNQVQPQLLARASRDGRFRAQLTAAADRVLRLKRRLGLRPGR
jgi:beta-N-acetylhexosaminidase